MEWAQVSHPKEFFDLEADEFHCNETTGMEYYLYRHGSDLVVGVCLDAVGLMTYYYINEIEWDKVLGGEAS